MQHLRRRAARGVGRGTGQRRPASPTACARCRTTTGKRAVSTAGAVGVRPGPHPCCARHGGKQGASAGGRGRPACTPGIRAGWGNRRDQRAAGHRRPACAVAAAQPEAASAVPADAKLVPTQRPPAEQWPDHRDGETTSPQGKQAASPAPAHQENGQASPQQVPAERGNGQASPEQVAPRQGNGRASLGKARPGPARAPARPPKPAPPKAPAAPPVPSRPRGRSRPGRAVTGGAIVMLFLLSAGSAFLLTRHAGMTTARPSADSQVAIRDRAAAWVASQVSRSAPGLLRSGDVPGARSPRRSRRRPAHAEAWRG